MPKPHSPPDAVVSAVLATLVRATADARIPVTLRSPSRAQARALEGWLSAVHGSRRTVVHVTAGRQREPTEIEVRLPARMAWPAPSQHLSAMAQHTSMQHPSRSTAGSR